MATSSKSSSVNEGFRTGGDVTLRSLDGVEFNVHSVILSLASPVLSHMFYSAKKEATIDVAETSEMLAFMLRFIYPCLAPPVSSFEMLGQGLHLADKYQLEGMRERLREKLSVKGSPVSVFADPLRALAFATVHDLAEEAALAVSIASESRDFRKPENLIEIVRAMPSVSPIVKMIGIPSARVFILIDVLFQFHQTPMSIAQLKGITFYCSTSTCHNYAGKGVRHDAPVWQVRWAYLAFQELHTRNISDCARVFAFEFFRLALYQNEIQTPPDSCDCLATIPNFRTSFETWAASVRESLMTRLKALDPLDTIA